MKKYENFIRQALFTASLLWLCLLKVQASDSQSYTPEHLTELARVWVTEQLTTTDADTEVQLTALDNRIGNKSCAHAPEFSLPANYNPRQTTVQVSCGAPLSWQLFIPARLTEWLELVVSRQNMTPGTTLTADMLEIQRRERRLVRGTVVQAPDLILGSRTKRSLSVGQIISLQDLCLVCRGDIVTIQISQGGLAVSTTGVAQQDGSLGDTVQVKNQQSGRNISSEVVGVNQVRIKF